MSIELLRPVWPVDAKVRAMTSTRSGGCSTGAWTSLNLGDHVGDDAAAVDSNRRRLSHAGGLPSIPVWLRQVHGTRVVPLSGETPQDTTADAAVTRTRDCVCVALTADCLPVFLAAADGTEVGVVHAGWRGLAAGVVEAAVATMTTPSDAICAWLGPAIGPDSFEVGDTVHHAFVATDAGAADCFRAGRPGHWYADLYGLARRRLDRLGVGFVGGGGHCTYADPDRFFSYRRDRVTGRMASMIWIAH